MLNIFVWWIGIRNFTYFSLLTWYLKINGCCKSRKVDPNITWIGFKPQWVDAHVNNFLTIQARELKFCVCYFREKSAPLTNFQPNWTTTSKVSDFGHFICRVSLPKVLPPPPAMIMITDSMVFLKPSLSIQGATFYVGPKCWFWIKSTFSSLSTKHIWNVRFLWRVVFLSFFLDNFRNPKILHVACHNLSQIDVAKTLCPFQEEMTTLIHDPKYWYTK